MEIEVELKKIEHELSRIEQYYREHGVLWLSDYKKLGKLEKKLNDIRKEIHRLYKFKSMENTEIIEKMCQIHDRIKKLKKIRKIITSGTTS